MQVHTDIVTDHTQKEKQQEWISAKRTSVCCCMFLLPKSEDENLTWQTNGRSPVCTIKCRFRSDGLMNTFWQWGQLLFARSPPVSSPPASASSRLEVRVDTLTLRSCMASAAQEALAWSLWADGELLVSPDGLAVQGVKKTKLEMTVVGLCLTFLKGIWLGGVPPSGTLIIYIILMLPGSISHNTNTVVIMDNLVHLTWIDPEHLQILLNTQIRYNYICVYFYNKDSKAKRYMRIHFYRHTCMHRHRQTDRHTHTPKSNGTKEKGF